MKSNILSSKKLNSNSLNPKTSGAQPLNINLNFKMFGLAGTILLLFYAYLGRGLYFKPELLSGIMLIAVILALAVLDNVLRGETDLFKLPLDYVVCGLALVYLLSCWGAVNKPEAVLGVLKNFGYLAVYMAVSQLVRTWRAYRIILEFIYGGGIIVAFIGLLAAVGMLGYPGAYVSNSILSTLQYSNAMAICMAMVSIIGFALWSMAKQDPLKEAGYVSGLVLTNVALLGTQSRAVWLMYPVLLLVWIIGLSKEIRSRLFLAICYLLIATILISQAFYSRIELQHGEQALSVLLGGVLLTMAGWIAIHRINLTLQRKPMGSAVRKFWQGLGLGYLLVVLVVYGFYTVKTLPGGWDTVMPAELTQQINTVTASDHSFTARFVFFSDALLIVRDYLVKGTGAGGWEALYPQYRTLPYISNKVHNHYLQVLVETGILGFTCYIAIWKLLAYTVYRLYRRKRQEKHWPLIWGVFISLLAIALHSMFDFDLSIPTLFILTWCLLALIRNAYVLTNKDVVPTYIKGGGRWLTAILGLALTLALFIPAYRLNEAGSLGAAGAKALAAGDLGTAEQKLQAASLLEGSNASYQADLAKISLVYWLNDGSKEKLKQGITLAEQAVQKEPHNLNIRGNLITAYIIAEMNGEATAQAEKLVQANPMDIKNYELLAEAGVKAARYAQQKKQTLEKLSLLAKVVTIPQKLDKLRDQVQKASGKAYLYESFLKMTPQLNLNVGQAYLLLNQPEKAKPLLEQACQEKAVSSEQLNKILSR